MKYYTYITIPQIITNNYVTFILFKPTHALFLKHIHIHI